MMGTLIQNAFDQNILPLTSEVGGRHVDSQPHNEVSFPSRKGRKEDSLQYLHDAKFANAALRQAMKSGFLVSPSKKMLLSMASRSEEEHKINPSLQEIKYIHLTNYRIRTLGYIQSCHFLTICILHSNYLTRFAALENCPFLKRIDLHSNQIVKLPDENFWSAMKRLLVLNLHDNGIAKLESIQPLAKCQNLSALTLYDTPLSLKPSYRHHIVNSIWSLKALDHHVIGDDEIIEDAFFSKRFRALNPSLYVDLCPKETGNVNERTLEVEMEVISKIFSDINLRLRHGSPVTVIQRWIRGHICRKKLNISYLEVSTKLKKLNLLPQDSSSESHGGEAFDLDYDTYLKNRRPGSKTPSASTTLQAETRVHAEPRSVDFEMKLPAQFHISLEKLEENSYRALGGMDENITIYVHKDSALPTKSLFSKSLKVSVEKQPTAPTLKSLFDLPSDDSEEILREDTVFHQIPSQYPIEEEERLDDKITAMKKDAAIQCGDDPEVPNHKWRIHKKTIEVSGEKPAAANLDPLHDHVISNRESGKDVREAIEYWHDQEISSPRPKVVKTKAPSKLKDAVSLATLMAVTKAYRDRDRSDNLAMKVDRVMRIQQERMQSRQIVAAYKDEKRSAALSQRQDDRLRVAEAIQQADATKAAYHEHAQDRKQRGTQRHEKCNKEYLFSSDFSNQHISVSNALIRHDRQTAKETLETDKKDITNMVKAQLSEQAEMVKRYMEHKQLVSQLNASKEKARVDTRVAQDGNERFMKSRQRVANMKGKKAATQSYYHNLPATTNPNFWSVNAQRESSKDSPHPEPKHASQSLPPIRNFTQSSEAHDPAMIHGSSLPLPAVHLLHPVNIKNQARPSKSSILIKS